VTAMLVPDRENHALSVPDLSAENFELLIENNLGQEASPELWDTLLHPLVVRRTFAFLNDRFRDVEDQLAERRAGIEAIRQQCHEMGPDGKERYFAANGEYQEWRRRAIGYRRVLGARLRETKEALGSARPHKAPGAAPNPANPTRRIRQLETVFRLAWAIHEHQQQSRAEDIKPEPHDLALWRALEEIEVEASSAGLVTVAAYLAHISSKPGFIPPAEREGEVA
jgi:hypothetical protein